MTTRSQRIMQHLEQLCVAIGARPGGSHANHQAADYIRHIFSNAGLQVEPQDFDCPDWACDETHLTVNGQTVEAAANTFSPACDVVAPVVTAGSLAELEAAELNGRIAVLYGELTKAPLAAKDWFLKDERDTRIVALLEQKAPAALLTVQAAGGDLPRIIEDAAFNIPSATVPARVGLALLCAQPPAAHLRIHSRRSNGHACNIVARTAFEGTARIVLCAHYDTKFDTPGAFDNGSGVAILLALAQTLGAHERACGLEFVAFTQEEYLPLGDDEYVRRAGEEGFARMLAAINISDSQSEKSSTFLRKIRCLRPFSIDLYDHELHPT
ncbi:MAG: M28 family peptidase, partial [Chloroflexi bacterium]|nr:M28 family peptidase [Chloroflexota bacterium]